MSWGLCFAFGWTRQGAKRATEEATQPGSAVRAWDWLLKWSKVFMKQQGKALQASWAAAGGQDLQLLFHVGQSCEAKLLN